MNSVHCRTNSIIPPSTGRNRKSSFVLRLLSCEKSTWASLKSGFAGVSSVIPNLTGSFHSLKPGRTMCIIPTSRGTHSAKGKEKSLSVRPWQRADWEISFCWCSRFCRPTTRVPRMSPWIAGGIHPALTATIRCPRKRVAPVPYANTRSVNTAVAIVLLVAIISVPVVLTPVRPAITPSVAIVFLNATLAVIAFVVPACLIKPVHPVLRK